MASSDDLRKLLGELDSSQWRRDMEHRAWQLELGTRLLRYAVRKVPFYARLRAALPEGASALMPDQWRALPLLKRSDIQRHAAELVSRDIPPVHLPLEALVTSGSTGSPVEIRTTGVTRLFWNALTLRDHLWHERNLRGRLVSIRYCREGVAAYPRGHLAGSWGLPASLLFETGGSAVLNIQTSVEKQLEWLRRQSPTYLTTYPSNALELGGLLTERRIFLPTLRELRLFGEVADEELLDACRKHFGVPVVDMYSANEVGYLALQCREFGHYHEQAESVFVEVLDAMGSPCQPGGIGRVVVTALWNYGMPLIRYEIGDYAEIGSPCACGRGLPVIRRILGRSRNLLTLPSGERRWPSFGVAGFRAIAPVLQCQVIQHSRERLEARLVTERALTEEEEERIRNLMIRKVGCPFEIDLSYHDRIERSPTSKFEEFKSVLG